MLWHSGDGVPMTAFNNAWCFHNGASGDYDAGTVHASDNGLCNDCIWSVVSEVSLPRTAESRDILYKQALHDTYVVMYKIYVRMCALHFEKYIAVITDELITC